MSEVDQLEQEDLMEDVEMASIAEEEELEERFSLQGMSTGRTSGKMKIVSIERSSLNFKAYKNTSCRNSVSLTDKILKDFLRYLLKCENCKIASTLVIYVYVALHKIEIIDFQ